MLTYNDVERSSWEGGVMPSDPLAFVRTLGNRLWDDQLDALHKAAGIKTLPDDGVRFVIPEHLETTLYGIPEWDMSGPGEWWGQSREGYAKSDRELTLEQVEKNFGQSDPFYTLFAPPEPTQLSFPFMEEGEQRTPPLLDGPVTAYIPSIVVRSPRSSRQFFNITE